MGAATLLLATALMSNRSALINSFNPASVFSGGEQGLLSDPSDFSTLFQDAFTETPVTGIGQPVGFVASKDRADNVQPWVNIRTDLAGWGPINGQTTLTSNGTSVTVENASTAEAQIAAFNSPVVAGRTYMVTLQVDAVNGSNGVIIVGNTRSGLVGGTGIKRVRLVAGATQTNGIRVGTNSGVQGQSVTFSNVNVREIRGNFEFQGTAASRPVLARVPASGVRNLATGSADVGNATYFPNSAVSNGITATKVGSGLDADGLPYVDYRFQGTSTGTFVSGIYQSGLSRTPAQVGEYITASGIVRFLSGSNTGVQGARIQAVEETAPSTFIAGAGSAIVPSNVDTPVTVTRTIASGNQARVEWLLLIENAATIDCTYRFKALQMDRGLSRTAFQFNYNNFNITEPGFRDVYGFGWDGVDDFFSSNVITPTSDKVQMFIGVRKLSDASVAVVFESSVDPSVNDGTFGLLVASGASNTEKYTFRSRGTISRFAFTTALAYNAPVTNVITGIGDISADNAVLRANGSQVGQATTDQGNGIFLPYVIYTGRRGGTSLPFYGITFRKVLRFGPPLPDAQVAQMEAWINSGTGAS